jgi:hypothetical protein
MEFLEEEEEERSEWLTGDDESTKMASVALFTARWRKVEILNAHWVSQEMVLWRRKKMLVRIHFRHWVGLVIIKAAAMMEEGSSRVGQQAQGVAGRPNPLVGRPHLAASRGLASR